MNTAIKLKDAEAEIFNDTITTYRLLTAKTGAVNGCSAGVTFFTSDQYNVPGTHEDQEGFYVLEGRGYALVGGSEIRLEEGTALLVGQGVTHAIRKDRDTEYIKLFWFHAAL